MSLLQMSISGAVFILAVVVIRALAINKLPKMTFMVLWGFALLRLLIGFSVPSVFSIYSLLKYNNAAVKPSPSLEIIHLKQNGAVQIEQQLPTFFFGDICLDCNLVYGNAV